MNKKTILQGYDAILFELNRLYNKSLNHLKERKSSEGYIYTNTYQGWIDEYNKIVVKYNNLTDANYSILSVQEYELSSSRKTVHFDAANSFIELLRQFIDRVDSEIQIEKAKDAPIPPHQMRKCFKIGARGCPLNPVEKKNKIFIAMPFSDDYKDSYEYGIKLILEQLAIEYYKADNEISNKDIMCKICREIQTCGKVIANISGLNPNVMLELGLAYGLGKDVIVIKDKKTTSISDLGSVEYIEYAHANELQQKLMRLLQ